MKKKLLTMAMAVLLPIGIMAGSGDVNDDGKVDILDIVELVNYLNNNPSENFKEDEADVNKDSQIDEKDVELLAKKILELDKDYIRVVGEREFTLDNDNQTFDVYMETDLDAYYINFDIPDNDKMGILSPSGKEETGEEGLYKWHFETDGHPTNYTGEDWEATVYFRHQDLDACDSVKVVFKGADKPTLTVSPEELVVENKERDRQAYIEVDKNYDWLTYEVQVTDNEDNWITETWKNDNKVYLEYEENYSGEKREAQIVIKNEEYGISATAKVSIESGDTPSLTLSPKTVTVTNKDYGRDIFFKLSRYPKWLEFEMEFIGDDGNWLDPDQYSLETLDDGTERIKFEYSNNFSGEDRTGQIVFKNEKYNIRETVTVTSQCADWVEILPDDLPDRWVRAQKREYNLIGIGSKNVESLEFNMVLRTEGISEQEDIGVEISGDDTSWLSLGPITINGCSFGYKRNETGSVQTATVRLYDKNGSYSDEVTVKSLPINFQHVNDQNMVYIQPDGEEIEFVLYNGADREVTPDFEDNIFTDNDILNSANGNYQPFIHHIGNEVVGNDLHIKLKIDQNTTDEHRWQIVNFPVRYTEECQKLNIGQAPKSAPSATEMRQALTNLYNSADGDNWYRHENWNTDKPLSQWEHLSLAGLGDYVWAFDLNGNTLKGTIPEDFGKVMEIENTWRIDHNGLYGRIPDNVINHPKWQEKGWNVVVQDLFLSGRRLLEYDDLKLKLPTYEIDHVNGNLKNSDELFSKNKVNVVMIGTPSVAMGNLHLAYHNKGYGTIVSSYGWLNGKREDSEVAAEEFPIKDIDFVWDCDWANHELFGLRTMGTWYVIDNNANLLACYVRDWDIPDEWYAAKVDSICRKILGEPEEHVPFGYYESQDYSKDSVVIELQHHTIGNGVGLVFVGEGFTDKDMDDNGVYEQQMKKAVDQFFAEEPYTSLRKRFDIYIVKAVSPNEEYSSDAVHAIDKNDANAFSYAKKALGENAEHMMVNVIWKNNDGATLDVNRSYTSIYGDGSYVAYNLQGGRVINHEGGGHGIGLLADEYVEGGYENAAVGEDMQENMDYMWETYGFGANVDYHSNPTEVRWARFLTDERYADEALGVYEGANLVATGCYRPSENSMMRYNDCGFNAPSREQIYKRVMKLSEGDDWEYDYEAFVEFDTSARQAYSQARSRARQTGVKTQQKRIESRPPTFNNGTWRDAKSVVRFP